MRSTGLVLIVGFVVGSVAPSAAEPVAPPIQQLTRDVYKELVEINTTQSVGDTFAAARAMAARLTAAGFARARSRQSRATPAASRLR